MATMIQRSSHENVLPTNAPEMATEPKSDESTKDTVAQDESSINMRRLAELMDAWGQGRFNTPETFSEAAEAFYTKDVVVEVGSANPHVGAGATLRDYSFDTLKDWFDWLGTFDLTDMVVTAVPSSKDPSQVWQQCRFVAASKATGRATGRSAYFELLNVIEFDGAKAKRVTTMYDNPAKFAYLSGVQEAPTDVKMPVFEPHPDPMPVFEESFAAWGAGEFAKAETKQAAFNKFLKPDFVLDASNAALPEVFKVYRGHEGADQWANGVVGSWEFTRMETTAEVGLKPGCVMQRLECDVKHAGKEAKGIVMYVEVAFDADGKGVYNKHFWANPKVAASLYASE